ncbi:conserved hypothetical protein [Mesorhizobium sp. ORS 3359]|nr:conserved hypothetical protein [Mesorhizobium sp. ORS 3359]
MDRFVARENIRHFVDRFHTENDDVVRSNLQKLLIEEEDKFARLSEQLEVMDQNLFRISDLALQQRARIYSLRANGVDTALAQKHLANLEALNCLFVQRRRAIAIELDERVSRSA